MSVLPERSKWPNKRVFDLEGEIFLAKIKKSAEKILPKKRTKAGSPYEPMALPDNRRKLSPYEPRGFSPREIRECQVPKRQKIYSPYEPRNI